MKSALPSMIPVGAATMADVNTNAARRAVNRMIAVLSIVSKLCTIFFAGKMCLGNPRKAEVRII